MALDAAAATSLELEQKYEIENTRSDYQNTFSGCDSTAPGHVIAPSRVIMAPAMLSWPAVLSWPGPCHHARPCYRSPGRVVTAGRDNMGRSDVIQPRV